MKHCVSDFDYYTWQILMWCAIVNMALSVIVWGLKKWKRV